MRIKDFTLVLLAAAMTGTVSAQGIISSINGGNWGAPTTGTPFYPRVGFFGPDFQSTVVNPDNTVTFKYQDPNAKSVKLWTQFSETVEMTKGEYEIWSVTVGPVEPDIYPYHFEVDGLSQMDPKCPDFFPNETVKNSLLDMRADKLSALKDVPHGSVDYLNYWSPLTPQPLGKTVDLSL